MVIMRNSLAWILWRAGGFVALVLAAVVVALTVPIPTVDQVRDVVSNSGVGGAALFVAIYALMTLLPVPKSVLSIASGIIWGLVGGVALVYIGALFGAALAFLLGRALGRDAIERFTGARVSAVDDVLRNRGFLSVVGVRLIPVIPFTVINYAAGLSAVRLRDYAFGTLLGIIPGTIAFVAVGAFGAQLDGGFYFAIGALGVLTIGGVVATHVVRNRHRVRANAQASNPPGVDS